MNALTGFLNSYHLLGITIGALTFLVIGLYHPLVVKGHYYFGTGFRWAFLVAGIAAMAASVAVADVLWSSVLGVVAFSSFWSIKEVVEQEERVNRGWFPRNPRRKANNKESK